MMWISSSDLFGQVILLKLLFSDYQFIDTWDIMGQWLLEIYNFGWSQKYILK